MMSTNAVDHDVIIALLTDKQRRRVYPGAVWAVGDADSIRARGQVGVLDPADSNEPMRDDTIFDIASLTKIIVV